MTQGFPASSTAEAGKDCQVKTPEDPTRDRASDVGGNTSENFSAMPTRHGTSIPDLMHLSQVLVSFGICFPGMLP